MSNQEFRILVAQLRIKQAKYFRTKSPYLLNECKALETKVNKELQQEIQAIQANNSQPVSPSLFWAIHSAIF